MTVRDRSPEPTRDRLITVATGLFRRQGVARAGIGEICERAGVTKGVFSHHFPGGKTDLIIEVVQRNAHEVEQRLADMRLNREDDLAGAVEQLFIGYADFLRVKGIDFGCPVAASVVDVSTGSPPVRAAARSAFDAWGAALRNFHPDLGPPNDTNSLIVAALEGGILMARAANDPSVLEHIGRSIAGLLRRHEPPKDG